MGSSKQELTEITEPRIALRWISSVNYFTCILFLKGLKLKVQQAELITPLLLVGHRCAIYHNDWCFIPLSYNIIQQANRVISVVV